MIYFINLKQFTKYGKSRSHKICMLVANMIEVFYLIYGVSC